MRSLPTVRVVPRQPAYTVSTLHNRSHRDDQNVRPEVVLHKLLRALRKLGGPRSICLTQEYDD